MPALELYEKLTLKQCFYLNEVLDYIEWHQQRNQAVRNVQAFKVLVGALYGQEIEDSDSPPDPTKTISTTPDLDEVALQRLLQSRQTLQHEVESFEKLKLSLQDQEEKRTKALRQNQ